MSTAGDKTPCAKLWSVRKAAPAPQNLGLQIPFPPHTRRHPSRLRRAEVGNDTPRQSTQHWVFYHEFAFDIHNRHCLSNRSKENYPFPPKVTPRSVTPRPLFLSSQYSIGIQNLTRSSTASHDASGLSRKMSHVRQKLPPPVLIYLRWIMRRPWLVSGYRVALKYWCYLPDSGCRFLKAFYLQDNRDWW